MGWPVRPAVERQPLLSTLHADWRRITIFPFCSIPGSRRGGPLQHGSSDRECYLNPVKLLTEVSPDQVKRHAPGQQSHPALALL